MSLTADQFQVLYSFLRGAVSALITGFDTSRCMQNFTIP